MTRDEGPGVGIIIFHIFQKQMSKVKQAEFKATHHCEIYMVLTLSTVAGVSTHT